MASDDFNRANGGLGANWTTQETAPQITSNHVSGGSPGVNLTAYYSATSAANDQESSAKLTFGDGTNAGLTVRASGTGGSSNYYLVYTNASSFIHLGKMVSGAFTTLETGWATPASGSVIKLMATGTTLEGFDDGVSLGTKTDASLASGQYGIFYVESGGGLSDLDDWVGADVGAPARRFILGTH